MSQAVIIEVYSDVVCPWCYVGKRRLERALQELKSTVDTVVIWRPFQLNPTMPDGGMDRTAYLEAKFGSLDAFRGMEERVRTAGAGEHISFAFDKILRTPNSFLAHRLIWYGGQQGCQDAVVEALFRGYFEEGADVGSRSTLGRLVACTGLSGGYVEQFLAGNEGAEEVQQEEAKGHQLGIRGVPYFVLNQTYGISGAQPVDALVSAVKAVRDQTARCTEGSSEGR